MSISLPDVISAAASLAKRPDVSDPLVNPDPADVKKIVIMITRDVSEDDRKRLSSFGLVKDYDNKVHLNLPLNSIEFDYLIVDLREAKHRLFYQKSIQNNADYHQVYYKWSWESDMGLRYESEFSTFPPNQHSKQAFDALLCSSPVAEPTPCLSFLGVLGKCGMA
jgi:hypothetical protein